MHDVHGPGAASVASVLLAFLREPALHRPAYIHGTAPLPDGHLVLKFALGRFPHGWQRDLDVHDRDELREAANAFVRQVCLWERASHYQLLCAAQDASHDVIRENYRLLMSLIHPDRQDAAALGWPTGSAQRVNQAYATLSDARARTEYDGGLRKSHAEAPVDNPAAPHVPPEGGRRTSRPGWKSLTKRFAVVGGVIAGLFVVQSWWVGEPSDEHTLLERTLSSTRWVRDALPGADAPRYLDALRATTSFDPLSFLAPPKQPQRLAALGPWTPLTESAAKHDAPAVQAQAPVQAPVPASPAVPVRAAAVSLAPVSIAAPAPAPPPAPLLRLAQVVTPVPAAPPKSRASAPTSEQVETLVALLVSYYETGDVERLMGLLDRDELGFWGGMRTRAAYGDFFAATRARRLRMNRLNWTNNGISAQARGEATVFVEYTDARPRVERSVPVELDIALREGAPRITRLVLFPGPQ